MSRKNQLSELRKSVDFINTKLMSAISKFFNSFQHGLSVKTKKKLKIDALILNNKFSAETKMNSTFLKSYLKVFFAGVATASEELKNNVSLYEIIKLLGERFKITRKIGKIKAQGNMVACDINREKNILENIANLSQQEGLDVTVMIDLWKIVMREVVREHKNINFLIS